MKSMRTFVCGLFRGGALSVGVCLASCSGRADYNRNTDWMRGAIGVFQHRLYGKCPEAFERIGKIDPKALADQLAEIGADYFCITLNQCAPSFLAPNDAYEDICGYRRGEICSQRDVPAELYEALRAKGVRLMLYSTGTPPRGDTNGVRRIGYVDRGMKEDPLYTPEGAQTWAKVFEFWSHRYGEKVSGWWIDGCWEDLGFDKCRTSETFAKALKAGNPNAVVSFNPGFYLEPYSSDEDYICGEINEPFFETCEGRWLNGRQWHLLSYLYSPASDGPQGLRYLDCEWADWLATVTRNGGCVTIDGLSDETACLLPAYASQLKTAIAAARGRIGPESPEGRRLARQRELLRRLQPIERAHCLVEHGKRHFSKHLCAYAGRALELSRVRRGPNGEAVFSDAIQSALDAFGGVCLSPRETPYFLDRPIVLKSGQCLWGAGFRGRLHPVPGMKGPLVTAAPNARDVSVYGIACEEAETPFAFRDVDGLVVRNVRLRACRGEACVLLVGVRNFRVDGVSCLESASGALACGVSADAGSKDGMVRNFLVGEGAHPALALRVPEGTLVDNCDGFPAEAVALDSRVGLKITTNREVGQKRKKVNDE